MTLELLANELLLELFEYISIVDLFHGFIDLNSRFNNLLLKQFDKHRLDFRSTSKKKFDTICQRYVPSIISRTTSLYLSDDDETPDQINCFLSYDWTLHQFTHLQLLSFSHLTSEKAMCELMIQCQYLHNLIYLNINECEFCFDNSTICQILNNIWSLPKLIRCYINVSFDERRYRDGIFVPSIRSNSLRHLTLKSMSYKLTDIVEIFSLYTISSIS